MPLLQKLVAQSVPAAHFLPMPHKSHPDPQSISDSFSSLSPLVQFSGFRLVSTVTPSLSLVLLDNPTMFCAFTLKKYLFPLINPKPVKFGFAAMSHSLLSVLWVVLSTTLW